MTARKGRARTPQRLWASSQARRGEVQGRKVKSSRRRRRWTTTPETRAASMNSAAAPTSQRPLSPSSNSAWKRVKKCPRRRSRPRGKNPAAFRVEGFLALAAGAVPGDAEGGFAPAGEADSPLRRRRRPFGEARLGEGEGGGAVFRGVRGDFQFRPQPGVDFRLENRERPGQEDGQQQPAENQPAPGVKGGEGLAQGSSHRQAPGRRASAASRAARPRGQARARLGVAAAKAQRMA